MRFAVSVKKILGVQSSFQHVWSKDLHASLLKLLL